MLTRIILIFNFICLVHLMLSAQAESSNQKPVANKQNSKITASTFDGTWKGEEKCKNIGSPATSINITAKNDTQVIINGMYSTTGDVLGAIKNNTIIIARQLIPDPIFMEMRIEGNLTLSKNQKELSGILLISNHDARDNCGVVYVRQGK